MKADTASCSPIFWRGFLEKAVLEGSGLTAWMSCRPAGASRRRRRGILIPSAPGPVWRRPAELVMAAGSYLGAGERMRRWACWAVFGGKLDQRVAMNRLREAIGQCETLGVKLMSLLALGSPDCAHRGMPADAVTWKIQDAQRPPFKPSDRVATLGGRRVRRLPPEGAVVILGALPSYGSRGPCQSMSCETAAGREPPLVPPRTPAASWAWFAPAVRAMLVVN